MASKEGAAASTNGGESDEDRARQRSMVDATLSDGDQTLAAVVLDTVAILRDFDVGNLRERHRTKRRADHEIRKLRRLVPRIIRQQHNHIDGTRALESLSHLRPGIGSFDGVQHVLRLETRRRERLRNQMNRN